VNWEENKHPRDNDGKFTSGGGTPAEHKRLKEMGIEGNDNVDKSKDISNSNNKTNQVRRLIDVLKKVKTVKIKQIHDYIKKLNPISLKMNGDEIIAEFDRYTANKNIFGHGKSDTDGYNYKISNPNEIPNMIKDSNYSYSKNETGKPTPQHKGVKQWHYFKKELNTEKGTFNVVVNIRDKGQDKFVYEIALKRKKT